MPAAYQKKVKEKIFIREIGRAKKERDAYLAEMDRAKKLKAILERKKAVRCFMQHIVENVALHYLLS